MEINNLVFCITRVINIIMRKRNAMAAHVQQVVNLSNLSDVLSNVLPICSAASFKIKNYCQDSE